MEITRITVGSGVEVRSGPLKLRGGRRNTIQINGIEINSGFSMFMWLMDCFFQWVSVCLMITASLRSFLTKE